MSCTQMSSSYSGYIISVGHSFNQIITCNFLQLRLFLICMKQHDDQIIKTLDFIIKLWSYPLNMNIVLYYNSSNQLYFQYYSKKHVQFNLDFLIQFFHLNYSKHDVTWSFPVNGVLPLIIKLFHRWLSLFSSIKKRYNLGLYLPFFQHNLPFSLICGCKIVCNNFFCIV